MKKCKTNIIFTFDRWQITGDRWHVTCDRWHLPHDIWHMTDSVGWTFSQNFSSLALPVWDWQCSEDIWTKGSPPVCQVSSILCNVSHLICHMSTVTSSMSTVTCHESYDIITPKLLELGTWFLRQYSPPPVCQTSHVRCYVSYVTCHVSHVTCHISYVTCHMSLVTWHHYLS